jgi:PKD repeat protein
VDSVIQPNPADIPVPAGTTDVWLRLTKTGTSYAGEYSFDGEDWTALASPVTNAMEDPSFGIFTLGPQVSGHVVTFDYFSVDGNRGECEEPEPENRAPAIEAAAADPQAGFAPLQVAFSVTASDPDEGDTLTYAWDFDGDGDTESTQEDPTHTYTAAGEYEAEVTVSDGEAERSRTVPVSVFGPDDPEARFRVLVFSKTAGFRHDSIDEGHAAIEELGEANDFQVDHTEDASIFNDAALDHYDTVVFLSTTGDVLDSTQQAAFERYVRDGGGFTGIHAAADTEYEWKWYGRMIGAYFHSHPPGTPEADVIVEDTDDHTTEGLPAPTWHRTDEWYNYKRVDFETDGSDYSPRNSGVHVLLKLDESSYDEQDGNTTDDDHPISWCQRYDGGRSWYTGMGHTAESFGTQPGNIRSHILGGIEVAAGEDVDSPECAAVDPDAPRVQAFGDPISGEAPLRVQFTSTAIDPNGPRLADTAFRWDFGDGSGRFGRAPLHTYGKPGVYTATLTVRDPEGKTGTDTVQITVNPRGNQLPTVDAVADPASGTPPLTVDFEAVGIDPDGDEANITYEWDFGDGEGQFGREVSHTYRAAGEYTVTVTATDEDGGSATATLEIEVEDPPGNQAPSVEALADPKRGPAPLGVWLTAAPRDVEDGNDLLVTWDFGDGTPGQAGERVFHTYTAPRAYTATVTVEDKGGLKATATVQVVVTGPPARGPGVAPPPPAAGDVEGESVSKPLVRMSKRHQVARVVKRGLRYTVACDSTCRVSATLRIAGGDKQRLGRAAARRIGAGDSRRLVLRLDRNVGRNLASAMRKAKLRNLRATLVLKIRSADGTTTVRKAVVLRR